MLKLGRAKPSASEDATANETATQSPQGITAKGNALRNIGAMALLATLVPVLLGFAYLILLREPVLQEQQIDRVASSFAVQQATNVHRLFTDMKARLQSAALSPLALSAIASRSDEDIALVEKAMLDYFPEVISLRIIPMGDMGTADFSSGNQGLRNHIEVDLVRRTSEGDVTQPEAYKFEDQWLTSMAARITHPRIDDHWAVILITINNQQLSTQLKSLDSANGKFAIEQLYTLPGGKTRTDVIAASGSGTVGANTRYADVAETPWRVSFSPSEVLLDALSINQVPMLAVLALLVVATIISLLIILILFPKKLEAEVTRVIAAADQKSSLNLSIPQLVAIARQLRRATLRALRQSNTSTWDIPKPEVETIARSQDLTNPMFQSKSMLDEDEYLDLEVPAQAAAGMEKAFPDHIFRAYDIRGDAQTELTDELVTKIARAIGSIAGEMGEQSLIVGCDGRMSSPRIKSAVIRALMATGRDVVDIGLVPTPLLYYATQHLNCRSGVMITGSHNAGDQNGLKIVLNHQTIAAGGIKQIRDRAITGNFTTGNGRMTREDIAPVYMEEVLHDIAIAVPLKIVIDAGNGATSDIAPKLFEDLGCEVQRLHCQIDGRFPGHPPDTSNEDNLADLVSMVLEVQADFGVAFDGDGDRLAVVTSSGQIVRSDVLLMLYAQDVVSRNPGADVVFDVKCSRHLSKLITRHGGRRFCGKRGMRS